jgi:hypothetical protein
MFRRTHIAESRPNPDDWNAPRTNVLCYHGMGGIGKSSLSRRCEQAIEESLEPDLPGGSIVLRIDLGDKSFLDPEAWILSIRGAVGRHPGSQFPAFDLALASYWTKKHPGEALQAFLDRSSWLTRVSRNDRLNAQVTETLQDLVDMSAVLAAGRRISERFISEIKNGTRSRRLLENCQPLESMLSSDPDDLLMYLPYLISWDISNLGPTNAASRRASRSQSLALTIFIDEFEVAQNASVSRDDIEDIICSTAFLMPNALFVVTGRNRLRWGTAVRESWCRFAGDDRWTGLGSTSENDNDQYLLGHLSPEDASKLVWARVDDQRESAEVKAAVKTIVDAAQGWPLYLELQTTRLERRLSRGQEIRPDDFGGPLNVAVVRVMQDLDQWERDLLRAASLSEKVDHRLLAAALPTMRSGRIAAFLEMSLVRKQSFFGLNDALRESISDADSSLVDRWDDDEWEATAHRVLTHLGERLEEDDQALVTSAFIASLTLGAKYSVSPHWLPMAAEALYDHGTWSVLRGAPLMKGVKGSHISAVALAAESSALRALGRTTEAAEKAHLACQTIDHGLTTGARDWSAQFSPTLADYVRWQGAACSERMGDLKEVRRYCADIESPSFRPRAQTRLGRIAWIQDNLVEAEKRALKVINWDARFQADHPQTGVQDPTPTTARSLLGWVQFTQGRFNEAHLTFSEALKYARGSRSEFFVASELCHIALVSALTACPDREADVEAAVETSAVLGSKRQITQARTAEALLTAGAGHWERAADDLRHITSDLIRTGNDADIRIPMLAEVIVLSRGGATEDASARATELHNHSWSRQAHRCIAVVGDWLVDREPSVESLQWGIPISEVQQNWMSALRSGSTH